MVSVERERASLPRSCFRMTKLVQSHFLIKIQSRAFLFWSDGHEMTVDTERSPMERLRSDYDHEELVCPECGYEDEPRSWESETNGQEVHYVHECPSCGASANTACSCRRTDCRRASARPADGATAQPVRAERDSVHGTSSGRRAGGNIDVSRWRQRCRNTMSVRSLS